MDENQNLINIDQHLLICLSEECAEISDQCSRLIIRVSKALRFGLNEIQEAQVYDNVNRISHELSDLLAVAEILEDRHVITRADIQVKKAKLEHFLAYAIECGACRQSGTWPNIKSL